jgi:hypothetical protein
MMNDPVALMVAPMTLLFGSFSTGMDLGFVDGAAAVDVDAVDGNFFSGTDAEFVSWLHVFEGDVSFGNLASGSVHNQTRGLRTEVEESADGGTGAAAGAEFHDLAEQDERGDGGGGFEVGVGISAHRAERGGEDSGRDGCDHAVDVGDAGAEADQREHVGAAVDQRGPEALEEGESAPEDDGSG